MTHFLIFGTHPRLSLAEFHALLLPVHPPTLVGSAAIVEITDEANGWDGRQLMDQLGGTVKLGDIVFTSQLASFSVDALAEQLAPISQGRGLDFGWTVYGGGGGTNQRISKLALGFKKALKAHGVSSRWVTGKNSESISPAAVAKLKMTTEGLDLCLLIHGEQILVGRTTHVQNADAWSERDYGRPARDEKTGMLPPKLARMMVNLAHAPSDGILLDPFCGGGTVLMEAGLATQGTRLIGSDVDSTQIANSKRNTNWLIEKHILKNEDDERILFFKSDVHDIQHAIAPVKTIDAVVTEGYLGPLLSGQETLTTLQNNVRDISKLWLETFAALKPLLSENARLVVIWPAFKSSHGMARVELDEEVKKLGYEVVNPLEGWDETHGPLLYARAEQRVMRRIVVLKQRG